MKRLITIITLFATATFAFADETKTANEIFVENFEAITVTDTSLVGLAARKALWDLQDAYMETNYATTVSYANELISEITDNEAKLTKTQKVILAYYVNKEGLMTTISFKVATAFNKQDEWISANNVTYSSLVSSNFTIDGIDVANKFMYIISNNDYVTAKKYTDILFSKGGVNFITNSLLDMTDASVAYEESKFWENVAIKKGNANILKNIQDIQDILYLRLTRDNKIQ